MKKPPVFTILICDPLHILVKHNTNMTTYDLNST